MTKQNNQPKRHHYIPQMMLRHFADTDGQLWFWRRDHDKFAVRKTNPQNLFVEKDLYTFTAADGVKDIALETFFSNLEGSGATFIKHLAEFTRNNKTPIFNSNTWQFWDEFLYYYLKRTPSTIAFSTDRMNFDKKFDDTYQGIRKNRAEMSEEAEELEQKDKIRIRKNVIVMAQAAKPNDEVVMAFKALGLVIYKITDESKSFVIGDAPGAMAKFQLPNREWSHPTLFLPLTWDIAVGTLLGNKKVEIIDVNRDQIRRMNIATTARSYTIAGRSDALIKSLIACVSYCGVEEVEDSPAFNLPSHGKFRRYNIN